MHSKITNTVLMTGAFFLLSVIWLHQSFSQQLQDEPTPQVNAEMVSLPVVVTTQDGNRIANLKKEDFRVFEDGIEQDVSHFKTANEPIVVALMLDSSASTRITLTQIQNAAIDFVSRLHPGAEVIVFSFAGNVTLRQNVTNDRSKSTDGIKRIRSGGLTAVYDAIWMGLEGLKLFAKRKALVLLTDGEDNSSLKVSRNDSLEMAKQTQATIFCIHYDYLTAANLIQYGSIMHPNHPLIFNTRRGIGWGYLKALSTNSGGMVFDGTRDLPGAFGEVAEELASQYSIGYFSSNDKRDGKFRKVEIKMDRPELTARTKKGYYARKP